jgi:viroplasmin and RNaseH domain-containing protein
MNIEHITEEVTKERKRMANKGVKDLEPLEDLLSKRIMKHFAEIEMLKRKSEQNLR